MDNYKVYCHTNKTNGKKYIGITRQAINKRWTKGSSYKECTKFWYAIQKYGWDGFTHEVWHKNLSKEEAEELEIKYIKEFNTKGSDGYNLDGGGGVNKEVSLETRLKQSLKGKGRKQSPEHIKKKADAIRGHAAPMKGKHYSAEHNAKIAEALRGVPHSEERRQHEREGHLRHPNKVVNRKPVAQYTLNNEYIKTWDSISSAANAVGGWHQNIGKVCLGKINYAYGFKWKYADIREEVI